MHCLLPHHSSGCTLHRCHLRQLPKRKSRNGSANPYGDQKEHESRAILAAPVQLGVQGAAEIFDQLDLNKDGVIDRAEWIAACKGVDGEKDAELESQLNELESLLGQLQDSDGSVDPDGLTEEALEQLQQAEMQLRCRAVRILRKSSVASIVLTCASRPLNCLNYCVRL